MKDFPKWSTTQADLTGLHVSSCGNIEDDGIGMLQVGGSGPGFKHPISLQNQLKFKLSKFAALSRPFLFINGFIGISFKERKTIFT